MNKLIDNKLLIEATVGSAILCAIAFWLQSRFGFGWADEGLNWYMSQRTFAGELPVRDFFSYDPARYYWNSLFIFILGNTGLRSVLVAAATFGGVGLAVAWYAMGVARVNIYWRIFFAVLITIALGYPRHKVYEQSLSLILVLLVFFILLSPSSTRRWFIFGLLAGFAAVFGRNHGVFFVASAILSGFYVVLNQGVRPVPRALAYCAGGVVIGFSPTILLSVIDSGFRDAFIQSVLTISQWQLPLPIPFFWRINYAGGFSLDLLQSLAIGLVCIFVPLTYFISAFLLYKNARSGASKSLLLLGAASLAGIPYLYQAFDRADFGHIAQAILPVFIAYAAIVSMHFSRRWLRVLSTGLCLTATLFLLAAWIPSQPAYGMLRLGALHPGATARHSIGGQDFIIHKYQSDILRETRNIAEQCKVGDREFLALPHYPGVYAYLNVKAPFWETYYLYKRSDEFQLRHIEAISNVKLILISPDATVDGLERLKLKNTYGKLLAYIEEKYKRVDSVPLPDGTFLYINPKLCEIRDSNHQQRKSG